MGKIVFVADDGVTVTIRENVSSPADVSFDSDFFAMKRWGREDVSRILEEEMEKEEFDATGISDADWEGLIDDVIDEGAGWNGLKECDDSEWNLIRDNAKSVLAKLNKEAI